MTFNKLMIAVIAVLSLAACHGDSNGNDSSQVNFTSFVKGLLISTSDRSEPLPVNIIDLKDTDRDNPTAYDSVTGNGN
ncbi:MAG: hypothetical protein R3292_12015 [Alcanivorax sp.]|nr:hypothetical protein [Alcanivorax sp.]